MLGFSGRTLGYLVVLMDMLPIQDSEWARMRSSKALSSRFFFGPLIQGTVATMIQHQRLKAPGPLECIWKVQARHSDWPRLVGVSPHQSAEKARPPIVPHSLKRRGLLFLPISGEEFRIPLSTAWGTGHLKVLGGLTQTVSYPDPSFCSPMLSTIKPTGIRRKNSAAVRAWA